ncbi:MAG: hypothetical protein LBQ16_05220 [Gracilibacteraceae bacterium]|jgi:hypothetical protein|nr:hypothetical protein [Gracilibacteraceae bacterium]
MIGREPKLHNDLFFVCSLIEYIGRVTKNKRADIVNLIGKDVITHYFELADVYHSQPIENTAYHIIEKYGIKEGGFDNISENLRVPTVFDIAKVYKRLIVNITENTSSQFIDVLIEVYNSGISAKIDDYTCSMYYENPEYIYLSYLDGAPLKD